MNRHAKMSTVTTSCDLTLRGQRSKGHFFKSFLIGKNKCQCVEHEQTCKNVHSDLLVRPIIKGSKVNEGQNLASI